MKLIRAHFDRRQAERDNYGKSLGDLLLRSGALEGPHKQTRPVLRGVHALRPLFARAMRALMGLNFRN